MNSPVLKITASDILRSISDSVDVGTVTVTADMPDHTPRTAAAALVEALRAEGFDPRAVDDNTGHAIDPETDTTDYEEIEVSVEPFWKFLIDRTPRNKTTISARSITGPISLSRTFTWTLEIDVDEMWVQDGFDLPTDEDATRRIQDLIPYASEDELSARVTGRPDRDHIARAMGYRSHEDRRRQNPNAKLDDEPEANFPEGIDDEPATTPTPTETDWRAIAAMESFGGSFVKALAEAWRKADGTNQHRLLEAFRSYYDTYLEIAINAARTR